MRLFFAVTATACSLLSRHHACLVGRDSSDEAADLAAGDSASTRP